MLNIRRLLIALLGALMISSLCCAASINCANSSTNVDRIICNDRQLSNLDDQLGQSYRKALQSAENFSALRDEQVQWLKNVRNKCSDEFCLKHVYLSRIRNLSFDCQTPRSEFAKLACSAPDKRALGDMLQEVLNEWKPYLTQLAYYPTDMPPALRQWNIETEPLLGNWTKGCLTLKCSRARIAEAAERWSFPKEAHEALLRWVKSKGESSPLLARDRWRLSSTEATAVWGFSNGKVYRAGPIPAWQTSDSIDIPPTVQPPFLGRSLTYTEALNLNKLITEIRPWTWGAVTVAGITEGMRNSVSVSDGGTAKCSRNPLYSGIGISGRIPDPPDTLNSIPGSGYKIVEVKAIAVDRAIPDCVFGDPFPKGFFPTKRKFYKSRVIIDEISDWFVRPDGHFWLKLSDDNWYRFKRDMTSEAVEIGSVFHIIEANEFEIALRKSKNIDQLDRLLMEAIDRREHVK